MTDNEVNKIIAEYMGSVIEKMPDDLEFYGFTDSDYVVAKGRNEGVKICHSVYTESLDTLIPVWEKLGENGAVCDFMGMEVSNNRNTFFFAEFEVESYIQSKYVSHDKPSIKQAAAHATAKAIKELF